MADKVIQSDIVNQETDGANAAVLINDTKRAINEVIDDLEDYVSNTETTIEEEFTGIAGQDTVAFVYTPKFVDVFYNGSKLAEEDFTATNGTTITLSDPVDAAEDIVTCKAYRSFSVGDGITQVDADGRYLKKASNLGELVSPTAARTNLGLGTMATVDVQTSPTDATIGAGLLAGAAGWLGAAKLKPTGDLNTYPLSGSYAYDDNTANAPSVENGIVLCELRDPTTSGLRSTQRAVTRSGAWYTRNNVGGVWDSTWQPVYTGANLNPSVFGGKSGFKMGNGYARSSTVLRLDINHSVPNIPANIIKGAGSYKITDTFFNTIDTVLPANVTVATSVDKLMTISLITSGLIADKPYFVVCDSDNTTIEVIQ